MSSSAPHRRRSAGALLAFVCLAALPGAAQAQTFTSTSNPAKLLISTTTAGPGSGPVTATQSGQVSISTPGKSQTYKITARLSSAMPAGTTLTIEIPGVGTSLGQVTLGTTAVDVVTGIGRNTTASPAVTYRLTGPLSAGSSAGTRDVTLSLVVY